MKFRKVASNDDDAEQAHTWAAEGVADHSGKAMDRIAVRRNGVLTFIYKTVDPCLPGLPMEHQSWRPPQRSKLKYLQRRLSAELARCRNSGELDSRECRLVDAFVYHNSSLRKFGRAEHISHERVRQLIEGLRLRAPLFWAWYRWKYQARRGRSVPGWPMRTWRWR